MDLCPFFKPIIRHFKSVCPTQSQLQPIILTSNHQMIERTFRCLSFSQVVGWSHFQISTVSVSLDCHRPRNVIYFLKATYDQQLSDFHFSKLYFSVYSKQTEWLFSSKNAQTKFECVKKPFWIPARIEPAS